jgi:dipeptidyl aminopeptidase/acylaminoacyl peptidase
MKIIVACCLLWGMFGNVLSQTGSADRNYMINKPVIDTGILGKFPTTDIAGISNNGKYYYYIVNDKINNNQIMYVQSDSAALKIKVDHVPGEVKFSQDSKRLIFIKTGDSLGILDIGTSKIKYVPGVSSFKLSLSSHNEHLAYISNSNAGQLTVQNLSNEKTITFSGATNFIFSQDGNKIVISQKNDPDGEIVRLVNLVNGVKQDIWTGSEATSFCFDISNQQLAFIGKKAGTKAYTIYYFKIGNAAAKELTALNVEAPFSISPGPLLFTATGKKIKFFLDKTNKPVKKEGQYVNVWNYKDKYLQSEQLSKEPPYAELSNIAKVFAFVSIDDGKIVRLNNTGEFLKFSNKTDKHVLLTSETVNNRFDSGLLKDNKNLYILSADDGKRVLVPGINNYELLTLSPDGEFILLFDVDSLSFYSFEINSHRKKNISATIPVCLYDEIAAARGIKNCAFGFGGWANEGHDVFIYDKYDIWLLDLNGDKKPRNITNGYGRKNGIAFGVIVNENQEILYSKKNELLLSAYNRANKNNGFWIIKTNKSGDPECRVMKDNYYYISRVGEIGIFEYPPMEAPVKAKYADKYLLKRMSYDSYPNWYVTDRFVTFDQISDLNPEKRYNWLKAELVSWKLKDGSPAQGILYKPENFDSTKKYPVIFHYYEKMSDQFHEYLEPDLSRARLNIPYFVSNGYLVFIPDIYHKPGHNGDATVNTVLSAARYLVKMSWIDSTKLGLQGHSFGGWETNHLITHTTVFAAACEAAGVSDQVSAYNQLDGFGSARQIFYEQYSQGSPYGKGVTPWTHPELYIANSPVFFAGNVTTPLLIMHGVEDKAVPFAQAIEMYLALKRAGKKVWLLEYEKAGHVLHNDAKAMDFTIRMKQFFDYYLKGSKPPSWMTTGVEMSD